MAHALANDISHFYPRSPCGERPRAKAITKKALRFLSTLSLRRATLFVSQPMRGKTNISIHALLAESDRWDVFFCIISANFYPRSPCGERHTVIIVGNIGNNISIHAFLAESDLMVVLLCHHISNFYPRSPCGERPPEIGFVSFGQSISIHALLAESDVRIVSINVTYANFYPRSPCGERPTRKRAPAYSAKFLSTLSLRRATHYNGMQGR